MPYQADGNQAEIIAALRAAGCSVTIIAGANGNTGVPDLLVGRMHGHVFHGEARPAANYLLEVKTPAKKGRSAGHLSAAQQRWHAGWLGQVAVVHTVEEAMAAVGLVQSPR